MIATNAKIAKGQKQPTYRLRKGYSQAIVTLTDEGTGRRKDYWLGEYGTTASYETYHRILAEWESNGRRLPSPTASNKSTPSQLSINEIILSYKAHVDKHYKQATKHTIYMALRVLRQFYGMTPADRFGPKDLRLVREQMIKGDSKGDRPRKPWCRTTINKAVHQIAAMFKWAASLELLSASVYQQLKTVPALRKGRCEAAESDGVEPIDIEIVEATKTHLNKQVKALVDLQLLTGARGGELFKLRPIDFERDKATGIWMVRPKDHTRRRNRHRHHLETTWSCQHRYDGAVSGSHRASRIYIE